MRNRLTVCLTLVASATAASAADTNNNGCQDAFEANGSCVSVTATVGPGTTVGSGNDIGSGAIVGADLALGAGVTIAPYAQLGGRVSHVSNPLPVGDGVVIGRRTTVGPDASLAADTVLGRSVSAGSNLTTGVSAEIGYGVELGDHVTVSGGVIGSLVTLGDYTTVGGSGIIARGVFIAHAQSAGTASHIDGIVGPDTQIGEGVTIEQGGRVRKDATLLAGATVHATGRVGRGATISENATVDGIVAPFATIGAGATVAEGASVQRGASVCPNSHVNDSETVASNTTWPPTGCVIATSCLDIFTAGDSTGDGVYSIDPDGSGGDPAYDAYCDMGNGGWTLALRASTDPASFPFFSPHWTTATTLNPTDLSPTADVDAKYDTYNEVLGTEIRGCLRDITTGVYGCKTYALPSERTLLTMFATTPIGRRGTGGYFFTETSPQRQEWMTMWGRTIGEASSGTVSYIDTGINIDDDSSAYLSRVRFGLAMNNEGDINTLNDTVGFGANSYYALSSNLLAESPWRAGAGAAFGSTIIRTRGQIWVR